MPCGDYKRGASCIMVVWWLCGGCEGGAIEISGFGGLNDDNDDDEYSIWDELNGWVVMGMVLGLVGMKSDVE